MKDTVLTAWTKLAWIEEGSDIVDKKGGYTAARCMIVVVEGLASLDRGGMQQI